MERKNSIILTVIAIATLLISVLGATFAYFTATIRDERGSGGNNGSTSITASNVASTTIVGVASKSAGSFEADDVYPGHKEVAALKITVNAQQNSQVATSSINIKWDGTNAFEDDAIKLTLYESDTDVSATAGFFNCKKEETGNGVGTVHYKESCDSKESSLGKLIGTTKLKGNDTTAILNDDVIHITANQTTVEKYYYIVAEYVEKGNDQNDDFGKKLTGKISAMLAV